MQRLSLTSGSAERTRVRWPACILAVLAFAASASLHAQTPQPAPLPDHPVPQETEAQRAARIAASIHAEGDREVRQQEQQRILTVVPNFNTVINGQGVRLSPGQKTHLAIHATLDPFNLVSAFLLAGLNEYNGAHRGYGWGPAGYFKRVGAQYLDVVNGTMLAGAVYPILLHQDPRFFRRGTGTLRSRLRHALLAAYIARGDSGRRQFNYSNVLGNFTGGALSNLYYPPEDRGVGLTLTGGILTTVEGSLGNIGLEFSPDFEAWWQRRRNRQPAPSSTSETPQP